MKTIALFLALASLAVSAALKPHAQFLPDPRLTPGAFDPSVTVETLPAHIASPRKVTAAMKLSVYQSYKVLFHPSGMYEIDHLISRELGGTDEVRNLWPQPYGTVWNAHHKDRLENELRRRVLARKIALRDAQTAIATDWIALYAAVFPDDMRRDGTPKPIGRQENAEPDK